MARSFAGATDRVNCGSITLPTIFSVCFWVKAPSVNGDNLAINVQGRMSVNFITAGTAIAFDLDNSGSLAGWWLCGSPTHGLTLANWNHIAIVHDSTSTANDPTLYCNGVVKAMAEQVAPTQAVQAASRVLRIGNYETDNLSIGGSMAGAEIHNVALTAAEVLEAMHRYSPRGRMAHFRLGDGSPEPDLSGNGLVGTVTGTTVVAGPSISPRFFSIPNRAARALTAADQTADVAPATSYALPPGVDPAASGNVTLATEPATSYALPPGVDPLDLGTLLDVSPATSYAEPPGVNPAGSGTATLAVEAATSYAVPPGVNPIEPQTAEPRRPAGPLPWMVFGGMEIGNSQRTISYLQNPYDPATNPAGIAGIASGAYGWRIRDFDCCSCPVLATDGAGNAVTFLRPDDIGLSLGDPAPWYDPAVPESAQFLGTLITEITGLDSTVSRPKIERAAGLGGAALGAQRAAGREINVKATLVATSCAGLDYGRRWLSHALANDLCDDCETYQLEIRTTCPPDDRPDVGLANLYEVGLSEGPKVIRETGLPDCCDLLEVEWTMTAGNPLIYACPVEVTPRTEVVGGPEGVVVGTIDPPEPFGTIAAQITVETGTVTGQGFLVRAWDRLLADPCPGADGEECLSIRLAGLPDGVVVTIDGARQRLYLTDTSGAVTDGLPYVVLSDGQAFGWPEFVGCQRVCVAVSVYADPGPGAPVGASVTIASQHRFLA